MFSERVQAAMVALFVLAIVGVVGVLLTRSDRDPPAAQRPSPGASDDIDSAAGDPVGRVSLNVGKGDLVLRITAGSCAAAGGPKLELSKNRGRSFREILVPQIDDGSGVSASSPKVRAIVGAEATSALAMSVVAADTACDIHRYTTSDGGVTWTQRSGQVQEWYLDPKTGGVVSPAGPTEPGCGDITALAPYKKLSARVFCADGRIRGTIDRGITWTDAGRLAHVSAAVFIGPQAGYAAVSEPKCKSRIHATVNGGLTWTPVGCVIDTFEIPALTGTAKRLVAGGRGGVRLSTNNGATWKPSLMK